jgi:hypothetical protein
MPAPVASNPLCGRQRDNDLRCNPTASACLRQAIYNQCVTTKPLYRPALETSYLKCYPTTLGCDATSQSTALSCAHADGDQIAVSATLTMLANNACQRCPNVAKDQVTDPAVCTMNLTTNGNDLARTLRYYTDETLTTLNSCLVAASPPAEGCIAFSSCYQKLLPPAPTCSGDGGV